MGLQFKKMTSRTKSYFAIILGLALMLQLPSCADFKKPAIERPNIVVIMVDDMGYSDISSYGGEIETPNLDRLAENGLRFTAFYNAARCCPTRASLLTGLYPHQTGMGAMVSSVKSDPEPGPYQGFLNPRCVTIAEVLRSAGYRTYMSGKWHVGEKPEHWPRKRGFDRYFGLISGASSYYEIIKDQPRIRQMVLDDDPWKPPEEGFYMTDAFSDHAVRCIREHRESHPKDPFFLYLAYTAPHWPLHALPEDIAKYQSRYEDGWDALRAERHRRMLEMGIIDERYVLSPTPPSIPAWEDAEDKDDWQRRMAVYAAMIDRADQGIGQLVSTLEEMEALDNTLVLFLSDNGGCAESVEGRNLHTPGVPVGERGSYVAYKEPWANVSNTPFRLYKQWTHEGGIATPLIAHWPAGIIQPGRISDAVGHVIDIVPTILDVARVPYPDSFDGRSILQLAGQSLSPVFKGMKPMSREALYWEHIGSRAVRQGRWKLVMDRRTKAWELYNLDADPTELNNLAEKHPERVRSLAASWERWAERVGLKELNQ
jgi:arylsulfatase